MKKFLKNLKDESKNLFSTFWNNWLKDLIRFCIIAILWIESILWTNIFTKEYYKNNQLAYYCR